MKELLAKIAALPSDWHEAGTMTNRVLTAIARHARDIEFSVETGSGKSTLLLSHLSASHKVFAKEDAENHSIEVVRRSPLFNASNVEFVEGPTQLTLPSYRFERKLQFALIDGPHAFPFAELEYYFLYPHLVAGGLLVVDDIHIPTIRHLFDFLREEEMFQLIEVVNYTAFFRRTEAPLFDPHGDGWWLQKYNTRRFPSESATMRMKRWSQVVQRPARRVVKRLLGRT